MIDKYHTSNFLEEYGEEEYIVNEDVSLEYFEIYEDDRQDYIPAVAVSTTDATGEIVYTIYTLETLRTALAAMHDAEEVLQNIKGE